MCYILLLRRFSTGISEWPLHQTPSGNLANDIRNVSTVLDVPALPDVPKLSDNHGNILLVLSRLERFPHQHGQRIRRQLF